MHEMKDRSVEVKGASEPYIVNRGGSRNEEKGGHTVACRR